MTPRNDIATRPDGSIDTDHYIARGRLMRSQQAHRMAGNAKAGLARRAARWLTIRATRAFARA